MPSKSDALIVVTPHGGESIAAFLSVASAPCTVVRNHENAAWAIRNGAVAIVAPPRWGMSERPRLVSAIGDLFIEIRKRASEDRKGIVANVVVFDRDRRRGILHEVRESLRSAKIPGTLLNASSPSLTGRVDDLWSCAFYCGIVARPLKAPHTIREVLQQAVNESRGEIVLGLHTLDDGPAAELRLGWIYAEYLTRLHDFVRAGGQLAASHQVTGIPVRRVRPIISPGNDALRYPAAIPDVKLLSAEAIVGFREMEFILTTAPSIGGRRPRLVVLAASLRS